ncbi:MAG: hypothetical protein K2L89_06850, partial [Muribaculaceae bacterium]|nr:hypothetical protein [Muribaculaceae bacterium]
MKQLHRYYIRLSFLIGMLGFSLTAKGVPAYPGEKLYIQPDGSEIHLTLIGDESFHTFITSDGIPVEIGADGYFYYRPAERSIIQQAHD